jgi:putative hydrolase of the HAD superfamily
MPKIHALLFDFGGTLDGNGVHWRERTYRFLKRERPEIDRETFDRADRASVEDLIASGKGPKLTLRETMDVIATGIYQRLGLDMRVKNRYVQLFCKDAQQSLDRNRRWLETLWGRYRLGVVSNNFGNTRGWCEEYGLLPSLDVVMDSTVVGAWKPDPRIFHQALSALEVPPESAVYTGDSYSDDMVGAKQAGMLTAWLIGEEQKACPDVSVVDVRLAEIKALKRFLEQFENSE